MTSDLMRMQCVFSGTKNHNLFVYLFLFFFLIHTTGCVRTAKEPETQTEPLPQLEIMPAVEVYVLAPRAYMLYMDSTPPPQLVSLGRMEDLPVFPSLETAEQALSERKKRDGVSESFWQIYRLSASWESVLEVSPGQYRMKHNTYILPLP